LNRPTVNRISQTASRLPNRRRLTPVGLTVANLSSRLQLKLRLAPMFALHGRVRKESEIGGTNGRKEGIAYHMGEENDQATTPRSGLPSQRMRRYPFWCFQLPVLIHSYEVYDISPQTSNLKIYYGTTGSAQRISFSRHSWNQRPRYRKSMKLRLFDLRNFFTPTLPISTIFI
jgi:hypothetical protein